MRVLLIAPAIPDYCIAFADAVATCCDVMLISPQSFFKGRVVPKRSGLRVRPLNWPRHRSLRNPLFLLRVLAEIRRYQPDIVHVLSEKNIWLNALLPFLRGTPIVTTVHDVRYHPGDTGLGSVPQWCTRLFIKQSNAIVVHGKTLREQAIRRLPVDECAIHVIPHVALPFYRDIATSKNWRPARDDSPMVLFFGRIRQYKGIDVLISAAALVASEIAGAQFVIAGQSDQETKPLLANATPPLFDVRDRFISDLEAARLFFEARLIVLPYVEGSQSGVLAIANTFGLPVVATDVGDLGATVIESRAGLVVPPNSPEALAQAIVKLLRDPKRLATARADSLNAAKFEFGPQNVGVKAAATYEKIVEAYRAQRRAPKSLDNRAK